MEDPNKADGPAMVDSVMIDPAYDSKVFNVAVADVPERQQDYVQGKYELDAPAASEAQLFEPPSNSTLLNPKASREAC